MTDGDPDDNPNPNTRGDETDLLPDAGAGVDGRTDAADEDGTDSTDPPSDAPPAVMPIQPEGTVPMFVAVGAAGRTVVSCDDGASWVGERSDDPSRRCFDADSGNVDCDHSSDSGTGIAYGNGWFVATFGWGAPGSIRRSDDGIHWESVVDGDSADGVTSSGLSWGRDMFVTGARRPRIGEPDADSWVLAPELDLGDIWNVREIGFAPVGGGTFFMYARDAEAALAISDDGREWTFSPSGGEHCTGNNVAYGGGVLLMLGEGGCRSVDGGRTWTPVDLPAAARTATLWTREAFVYWGIDDAYQDTMYTSDDGQEWAAVAATSDTGTMRLGPVARSPEGTYVGVRGEWQQWYEDQRFYRSEDGVDWVEVTAGNYTGGHPLREIAFGYGQPSELCPEL